MAVASCLAMQEVKAGGGAVGIGKDGGAPGDLSLAAIARSHLDAAPGESGLDILPHGGVLDKREAEELGGDLPRDVVGSGAEAAGDEYDVGPGEGLDESLADGVAIGDGDLALDPEAEGEELLAEIGEMGVEGIAEEELGTGVDEFYDHGWGRGEFLTAD
jgi:hypothetical protein